MPKNQSRSRSGNWSLSTTTSRWLILAAILAVAGVILWQKNQKSPNQPALAEPAEVQFERNLQQQKPMLAFFHSTDCHSCIEMMELVDEVYPQFQQEVALVDVNVYDAANQNLLRRARILSIPTQIFIKRDGSGKVFLGVMSKEQLRQELQQLTAQP
ncbi:MAG: thioredoxin family protein [Bellilinea sp.]